MFQSCLLIWSTVGWVWLQVWSVKRLSQSRFIWPTHKHAKLTPFSLKKRSFPLNCLHFSSEWLPAQQRHPALSACPGSVVDSLTSSGKSIDVTMVATTTPFTLVLGCAFNLVTAFIPEALQDGSCMWPNSKNTYTTLDKCDHIAEPSSVVSYFSYIMSLGPPLLPHFVLWHCIATGRNHMLATTHKFSCLSSCKLLQIV